MLEDVLDGFVSADAAASRYGVIVDIASKQVDEAATRKLRNLKRPTSEVVASGNATA